MNPEDIKNKQISRETVVNGILDILCDKEILNREDTIELKREFEDDPTVYLEDYLIDEGIVDKEDLLDALQEYYGVQSVDVMGEMFDHNLLIKFPKEVLLVNCCIPYRRDGVTLFMITQDPKNEDLDEILGEHVSYNLEYFVGIPRHIDMMIKDFYQDELYHDQDEYESNIEHAEIDREVVELEDTIKERAIEEYLEDEEEDTDF
jgi:hypothetical protein